MSEIRDRWEDELGTLNIEHPTCFVETVHLSRSDLRKLASHKVAGTEALGSFVLKGQRKDSWFPPSFQDAALRWDFQPMRGWLISIVASGQLKGFYRAHPTSNAEMGERRIARPHAGSLEVYSPKIPLNIRPHPRQRLSSSGLRRLCLA
jgi:hypothetical protein